MVRSIRTPGLLTGPAVSRRSLLLGLTGAAVAAQLAGCAGVAPPALLAADVSRETPPRDAPVGPATDGLVGFGYALARATGTAGNWLASPLSIATAFAMARVGARGTTASQLDKVFGFPADGRDGAFNAITRALVTTDVPPKPSGKRKITDPTRPPVVSIGDALFTAKRLTIGQDFLHTLAAQYGAGVRPVDFGSSDAVDRLNAWVRQQTAGLVSKIVDELDPATVLVLANTVYFRGDWELRFSPEMTADRPFTTGSGQRIFASSMSHVATAGYAKVPGGQVAELPYAHGDLAMRVLLPDPGGSPQDMLAPRVMSAATAGLTSLMVDLTMPKWEFKTAIDLTGTLPAMGLTVPFSPNDADFSGIADGLFLDGVNHAAVIRVDELGTEAAAATAVGAGATSLPIAHVRLTVDRPFAFAIVGGPTRVPLFVGIVRDPTRS